MSRRKRFDLPGYPLHVVQRGVDRRACFFSSEDYQAYLNWLLQAARHYQCAIHAYVLMTNHVHLLVTPQVSFGVGRMMQYLGRYYVRYVNHAYGRTGTLWEGRYKASVVGGERYLLACYRYIELNPVRAGMVSDPADYPWSSYRYHAHGEPDGLVREHEIYTRLGPTREVRTSGYRRLFEGELGEDLLAEVRAATQHCHVLGGERFKAEIEAMLGRRLGTGRPGRPRKDGEDTGPRPPGQVSLNLEKY